jgi:trehalose-6-phosphate synthase
MEQARGGDEKKGDSTPHANGNDNDDEKEEWHFTKSSGGLVSALNGVKGIDMTWIGWPGEEIKKVDDQKEISSRLQKEMNCVPVFLPKSIYHIAIIID